MISCHISMLRGQGRFLRFCQNSDKLWRQCVFPGMDPVTCSNYLHIYSGINFWPSYEFNRPVNWGYGTDTITSILIENYSQIFPNVPFHTPPSNLGRRWCKDECNSVVIFNTTLPPITLPPSSMKKMQRYNKIRHLPSSPEITFIFCPSKNWHTRSGTRSLHLMKYLLLHQWEKMEKMWKTRYNQCKGIPIKLDFFPHPSK